MSNRKIGIGLDENTAVVVEGGEDFYVLGDGAVYVVDCREVTDSNIADDDMQKTFAIYNVKLHLLSLGDAFDMGTRLPKRMSSEQREKKIPQVNRRSAGGNK